MHVLDRYSLFNRRKKNINRLDCGCQDHHYISARVSSCLRVLYEFRALIIKMAAARLQYDDH